MRRKWPALLALALLLAVGGAVPWLYAHPPLQSGWISITRPEGGLRFISLELKNRGSRPAVLTEVTLDGRPAPYPEAKAFTNEGAHLAFSAAIHPGPNDRLKSGPVEGWQILSREVSHERWLSYAVLVNLPEGAPNVAELVIHYRYLGLPMRLAVTPSLP